MARTVTVSKKAVHRTGPLRYVITLNMLYKNDDTVLIDKDYPQEYLSGENPSIYVARWDAQMQQDINDYKAEENIFNAALLNTAITTIQNGLEV